MSDSKAKDLKARLKQQVDNDDISMNAAARAIGYSGAAISSWLSDKYDGDVPAVEAAVERFLKRRTERKADKSEPLPFIRTSVVKKVHEVARRSLLRKWLCVCYGDAGIGKTEALRAFAEEEKDVILIEAVLGLSSKALFSELHDRVGLDGQGGTYDMFMDVVKKLKGSDRMLIIDEAENLPYRALELIRRLYDKAGIGVLLVGMPKLITNLRGKRGQYAQLHSRVRLAANLDALNGMDVHDIVDKIFPNQNGIWKVFYDASKGNARVLSNLIENARDIAKLNNIPVTPEVVKETAKMLLI